MEIGMTDIVSGEKAAKPPTLAVTLLTQFSALDSNRNNLPERRGRHLKSTSIGNTSLLPQQVRDKNLINLRQKVTPRY